MQRVPVFIIVTTAVFLGACAAPPTSSMSSAAQTRSRPSSSIDVYRYALSRAVEQSAKEEFQEAYPALVSIIASPVFNELEPPQQHVALMIAGLVAIELGKPEEAHSFLVRSTAMKEASHHDWSGRLSAAYRLGNTADSIESLTQIARRWPAQLSEVNYQTILELVRKAQRVPQGAAELYALLDALYAAEWKIPEAIEPSFMWRDLALLNLERNQTARAREVSARVESPHVLLSMRIDKRFDPLREAAPEQFNIETAVAKEIASWRASVERSPRSLDAVVQLTYSLMNAGRYIDVLDVTAEVAHKVGSAGANEPPYDDMDSKYIWILDNRARALTATQQWREAESEIRSAANRKENGHSNVSNVINLAWFYAEAGRADESLATLVDVGQEMSPYGLMQLHGVRYAAAIQKGDAQIADESFAYLREHRLDAIGTWQWTLVRANRLDEAAELLITRLRDPMLRSGALAEIQEYTEPPAAVQRTLWNARWRDIMDREDVRKAIDSVGRVEKFSIPAEIGP